MMVLMVVLMVFLLDRRPSMKVLLVWEKDTSLLLMMAALAEWGAGIAYILPSDLLRHRIRPKDSFRFRMFLEEVRIPPRESYPNLVHQSIEKGLELGNPVLVLSVPQRKRP
jgi:hypothetical protein